MIWVQKTIQLPTFSNGVRLITREILEALPEMPQISSGILNIFLQHTSASISINENADPDVQHDLNMALDRIVPKSLPYEHTLEGQDDMPSHVKSSMIGVSLNIPVGKGRLLLGTWQGIYLCEHRHIKQCRSIVLTLFGKRGC